MPLSLLLLLLLASIVHRCGCEDAAKMRCRRIKLENKCKKLDKCSKFYPNLKSRCMKLNKSIRPKSAVGSESLELKISNVAQDYDPKKSIFAAKILSGYYY